MTQNTMVKAVPYHAKRGSGGIALPILNLGATLGWMVNTMPQLLYP
jgi:H+/Cl- antiporter ClcA